MDNTFYHKCAARFLMPAASAALILAGCSKTENSIPDGRTELRLTSTIELTRAGNTQATQIVSGQKVSAWVKDNSVLAGNGAALYAVDLTAGDGGALTSDTKMYYPQTGNGVQIDALHGNLSFGTIPGTMPESIVFSVSADQSASGGENYLKSDLLYASRSASRSGYPVSLQFYHLLSKMELNIGRSTEVTDGIASVSLDGVALGGTFTPGSITDISAQSSRKAGISAGENTGSIALGVLLNEANEAIVVPQDMAGKTLTFTLASGGKLVYTFPAGTTFESGRKYVYNVTLKLTELTVTSNIADWGDTTPTGGDATMPGLGSKSADQARKGDFAMIDGTFADKDATLSAEQIAGCTGIVFWTEAEKTISSTTLADDAVMAEDFPLCTHGLIVALKNISNSMIYQTKGSSDCQSVWNDFQKGSTKYGSGSKYKAVAPDFDKESEVGYDYSTDPFNQILGYQNTKVTLAYNDYASAQDGWAIVQPVAALGAFEKDNPAPAGSTGWYIPSIKELTLLAYGDFYGGYWGDTYAKYGLYCKDFYQTYWTYYTFIVVVNTLNLVNQSLEKVSGVKFFSDSESKDTGGSHHYRSSTEGHSWSKNSATAEQKVYLNNAYTLYFYQGNNNVQSMIGPFGKPKETNVRAVCAF